MKFPFAKKSPKSLIFVCLVLAVLLLVAITSRISLVQASSLVCEGAGCGRATLPLPTARPAGLIPRLCGKLVFVTDSVSGLQSMGLLPCTGHGKPYIFKRHPRDIVPFYQFRDAVIQDGVELCTVEYGCINRYITTFKNYIGIDNCAACGLNVPPTWTHAPLTPYTPTPVPPTSTPYIPSFTPTLSPTLSPDKYTPTQNVFDLLRGTITPQILPSATASPTENIIMPSATAIIPVSITPQPWSSPLVCGIGFLLLVMVLAYIAWIIAKNRQRES